MAYHRPIATLETVPDVLTLEETGDILGKSIPTIKRWIHNYKLPAIRINERGDWRVLKSVVINAIERYT